ncbi:MAG: hypothetical protein A3J38_06445 [Gammaproteobacteria bacterium RIFCSPHIGHO2_12_FULL_45_9]|nr:MAG: hypothetical protein A3J38_06445 [Gammaproteobacteria bacterium RIFCSPHIGHO2_12_FULL_45_9]
MFDRLQKPFLTVETGEAYQPIKLNYNLLQKDKLIEALNKLKCLKKNPSAPSWDWFWQAECDDLHFESLDAFKRNPERPIRLGTITIREKQLYFSLPSFKRACLAVPFFHKLLPEEIVTPRNADFINKVFGLDERLPHGFTELFKDEELEAIVRQRLEDYHKTQERCEQAATAEEAFGVLSEYTKTEAGKRLPYAERYVFQPDTQDPDIAFLGFYIFLRGRELVAIKRWFGDSGYSLADAADETVEQVFGGMDIDILD